VSTGSTNKAIKEFIAEAEEILEKLNLDLCSLSFAEDGVDGAPDTINSLFRGAHSLKGLSGMFGFDDISELSHQLENLLDNLRLGRTDFSSAVSEVLFQSFDMLVLLVSSKGEGKETADQPDIAPVLAKLGNLFDGPAVESDDPLASGSIPSELLNVLTEYEEHRLRDNLKRGRTLLLVRASFSLDTFDQELAALTDLLKQYGELISTLPTSGDISERIGFQLMLGTEAALETVAADIGNDEYIEIVSISGKQAGSAKVEPEPVATAASESAVEEAPSSAVSEVKGKSASDLSEDGGASLRSISRTVRVDIDKLDHLMNIVGDLVLAKSSIVQLSSQFKGAGEASLVSELHKASRGLERRLDELQGAVMDVRMVPVAQLFEKMTRIVRRVANELGKQIQLEISGSDTELDKLIVEDLTDPLVHIIRNAVDHGVETPQERERLGKPVRAKLELSATQKGNHVVIEVADDGSGIDLGRVKAKGIEKGLIRESDELSREDLLDLLFVPGFSTKDEVSELSGRGVGMDVVKNNISALSGMIELNSEAGRGTTVVITLPITLAIIKALVVTTGDRTYAIPINAVLETLMVEAAEIKTIERREVIELRQSTLPLLHLAEFFGLERKVGRPDRYFVAVVGLAERRMGIVVDGLVGQQDVVIKSLGASLAFVKGVAGAADLGNQQTVLVLDVGGLMSDALRGEGRLSV